MTPIGDLTARANLKNDVVSGVCAVHFMPTMGFANQTMNTPLTKVGLQMYAQMRMQLGSTASYDATDIMMYLGAMDSAYLHYALGSKIYGMLRLSSPFNDYVLRHVAEANSIDYDSFAQNLENFRSQLNLFGIFLASRNVPGEFDIFARHIWTQMHMWKDSNTAKAQLYTMVPDGYYIYTEATSGPGYLAANLYPYARTGASSGLLTYTQWQNIANTMFENLTGSDVDQMSADIGKAFKENLYMLNLIPEEYILPIDYSEELMMQIENSQLCGYPQVTAIGSSSTNYWDIIQTTDLPRNPRLVQTAMCTQVNNGLNMTAAAITNFNYAWAAKKVLNFHKAEITDADVLVASRGVPGNVATISGATNANVLVMEYGTEVYTTARLFTLVPATGAMTQQLYSSRTTFNDITSAVPLLATWAQFDWAPHLWAMYGTDASVWYQCEDFDMYAVIDALQARMLNYNAVLSCWWSSKFPQLQ